jgi:alpha-mannosidase
VFFSDINLYSQLYRNQNSDGIELAVHSVPDLRRISFDEAVKCHFEPTTTGTSYGPSWVINVPCPFLFQHAVTKSG